MQNNLKIHFIYVTIFLTGIITLLITQKWTEIPEFTTYLSTAATMTSLFLGLIAIIYAFYSSSDLNKSLAGVMEAARDLAQSAKILNELKEESTTTSITVKVSTEALQDAVKQMGGEINQLKEITNHIESKTTNIEKLAAQLNEKNLTTPSHNQIEDPQYIKKFCNITSNNGLFLLKLLLDFKKKNKSLNLNELVKISGTMDYYQGYIVACASSGILSLDDANELSSLKVSRTIDGLESALKEELLARKGRDQYFPLVLEKLDELVNK